MSEMPQRWTAQGDMRPDSDGEWFRDDDLPVTQAKVEADVREQLAADLERASQEDVGRRPGEQAVLARVADHVRRAALDHTLPSEAAEVRSPFTDEGFAPPTEMPTKAPQVKSGAEFLARQWQSRAEKAEAALADCLPSEGGERDEVDQLRAELGEAEATLREINEYDVSPEVQKLLDVALPTTSKEVSQVGLTQIELEALLRARMGGTASELAELREAVETAHKKLWAALKEARGS